jgi:hypothetical protein
MHSVAPAPALSAAAFAAAGFAEAAFAALAACVVGDVTAVVVLTVTQSVDDCLEARDLLHACMDLLDSCMHGSPADPRCITRETRHQVGRRLMLLVADGCSGVQAQCIEMNTVSDSYFRNSKSIEHMFAPSY